MVVLIASKLPPAVRGRLRLWFVEPRANIFVSNIKASVADKVLDELWQICPVSSGLMVIRSSKTIQGFTIETRGETDRKVLNDLGFYLISDKIH